MSRAASDSRARPSLRAVYHHVTDHASSLVDRLAVSTPPDVFESHVRKLARGYQFVSLDEVLSGELPRRAILITFDDGYRSVAEVALADPAATGCSERVLHHGSVPRARFAPSRQPPLASLRQCRP